MKGSLIDRHIETLGLRSNIIFSDLCFGVSFNATFDWHSVLLLVILKDLHLFNMPRLFGHWLLGYPSPALGRITQDLTCAQWLSPFTASDTDAWRCWWWLSLWLHSVAPAVFLLLGHLSPQWICIGASEALWGAVNTDAPWQLLFDDFFELWNSWAPSFLSEPLEC